MKRLLRALEVLAWFAFFAFAALVLVLRYWVLPDIERYRPVIVAAISTAVGLPVKVGAIEGGWSGLRPHLTFSDVRILDEQGREALVLPSVHNVVSYRSLLHGDLRLHSLVIDGPRLTVRRDPAGALFVAGIRLSSGGGNGRFGGWALAQEEIIVRRAEIEWRDEKRGAPPLTLSDLELTLRNGGGEHAFGLKARPPVPLGSTVELRAHFLGDSGRVYAELGTTSLAEWKTWIDYPFDVRQGHGALRLWVELAGGKPTEATADVALSGVVAQLGDAPALLELASLRGRLEGKARGDGYEISGRKLAAAPAQGAPIGPADFQLAWRPGAGSFSAKTLDLARLPELAASFPMPQALRERLAEAAPRGRIEEAHVDWQGELPEPGRYVVRSRFSGLALRPVGGIPGFEGLSGSLDASESRGRLVLASRGAQLELPALFPEPRVSLDSLEGQVDWERVGSAIAVRLVSLAFANPDLAGSANGTYSRAGDIGRIDLSAQLSRADGTKTARYLPHARFMGEKTRAWLASSIVAGQASDVRLRLRGDLRDFPFRDPGEGEFLVTARVANGVLDYAPGWPRIEAIDASLRFEGERMEIAGRGGMILGAKLSGVRVAIPRIDKDAHLLVTGDAEGPSGEFLAYLAASPLSRVTGELTGAMRAAGQGRLKLKLDLPLADLDASKVAGEFSFSGNDVTVDADMPRIERASGRVAFTESGFTLHDVRGEALGRPVGIRGGTRADGSVEVVARGTASVEAVRELAGHPALRHLSGEAAYLATFAVRDGATSVTVSSPLRGVAIALPAPFAKPAQEPLPLRIELAPSRSGVRERVSVTLGRLAAAQVQRRREGEALAVRRASIWLSPAPGEAIRLPERPGTLVYGSLASLDADRWIELFKTASADLGEEAAGPISVDLKVGALDAYGKRVRNLAVRAGGDAKGWSGALKAEELSGDVTFTTENGGALFARLAHFTFPEDSPAAGSTAQVAPRQPADVPAVDAVIERFTYRGKDLGHVEFLAHREADAWRFEKLRVVNPEGTLDARGLWKSGAPSSSSLQFELESADTGALLARVGYPEHVKGGRAKFTGSLAWQGPLLGLDIPTLAGELELHAQEGQFLEVEPGIGKLISLMSLQALPRRIVLDFRDVFSKGFQFDRIGARAQVEKGVMGIREFRMRGSAADVQMSGSADLVRETQDLKVRVVPSLGDTASTAVAAIVNPVAGAAALLAQRVLKDPIGRIFAFDYGITGSWSDPKVERLNKPQPLAQP